MRLLGPVLSLSLSLERRWGCHVAPIVACYDKWAINFALDLEARTSRELRADALFVRVPRARERAEISRLLSLLCPSPRGKELPTPELRLDFLSDDYI